MNHPFLPTCFKPYNRLPHVYLSAPSNTGCGPHAIWTALDAITSDSPPALPIPPTVPLFALPLVILGLPLWSIILWDMRMRIMIDERYYEWIYVYN